MTRISSPARLAALRRTALLDTPPEAAFDRLTALAASVLRAPVALVSLVDEDRQFFKSALGLAEPLATIRETPLSHAICGITVELGEPLVIPDTRLHPLVKHARAATELGIVAYAGVPLTTSDNHVLGTICVMDRVPRVWTPSDVEVLTTLASAASTELSLRLLDEQHAETVNALRESEANLRGAFSHASIGMALTTFDGRFELVNPALCRILGFSEKELLGRSFQEISHPDELPRTLELLDELVAGKREAYQVEKRYFHKRGSPVWVRVDVTLSRSPDGRPRHLIAQIQDISDSKRAEEQLREAHTMLSTLVSAAPQAIVAVDLSWQVTLWNGAAERLFGWTTGEVLGRPIPFLSSERIAELRALQQPDAHRHGSVATEMRHARKDGSFVDTLFSTGILRDAAGNAAGYIAVVTDLTEHKALEAQLRQAQKMEAVGQLAGGVAHDFNNLLTVIAAHAFIALEHLPDDTAVRADLEAVSDAAGRAADLTRRLLAFSRKQILQPQELDLNAAVAGVLPMLERLIGEDIEVATQLAPALGHVAADPAQLEQVLMNLAVNARDAMPRGGTIRVETANVELSEAYVAQDGAGIEPGPYVLLEVGDTGCGIDAANQSRIFEPFFTTKEEGKGTGLGLAMVYGIVKQSGGFVRVHSAPGEGARFQIWLPRIAVREEEKACVARPASVRGGSETVLLVEDEETVREVVQRLLQHQGYAVHAAPNGIEALRLAREQDGCIDLVLTDVILPEMSGPEVADQLLSEWPRTRVLFMTGYATDEVARRGLLKPGDALLRKPFTLEDMAHTVRRVLDQVAQSAL